MNNFITLIGVALICSSLAYGTTTTITTTTTTTSGVTTVTKVVENKEVKELKKQTEVDMVKPRLSLFGAYTSLTNLYVPLTLKSRRNSVSYDANFQPSEEHVVGYGAELYLPFNNRFGISIGYKTTGEIGFQDINLNGGDIDQDVTLSDQIITKYDVAYLNLVLYFGKSLQVYGGFNYLTSPPSFESIYVNNEAPDSGLKMGWQAGLGYNLNSVIAVFAQYDVYYFLPSDESSRSLNINGTSYVLNTQSDTFTAVIQAGIRLDIGL
tara:strand:+ start:65 stop:862 length:798 start_codon:yes stop_codon:yes gene_type:complete